jgi:hypothetical protein
MDTPERDALPLPLDAERALDSGGVDGARSARSARFVTLSGECLSMLLSCVAVLYW